MPKITVDIEYLRLDVSKLMKKALDNMEVEMRKAAAEFAKTALAQIPVHTGFVAGAFGTLEALIGSQARFNPIVAFVRRLLGRKSVGLVQSKLRGQSLIQNEYYYPPGGGRILKTATSGQQFATPVNQIIQRQGNILTFNYEVDISYFNIQDVRSGRSPTAPWRAFENGRDSFIQYMTKAVDKLPNPFDFITKSRKSM